MTRLSVIEQGETFDFILIDGFHSFDLTLLDLFYADKLWAVGGVATIPHLLPSSRRSDGWKKTSPTNGYPLRFIRLNSRPSERSITVSFDNLIAVNDRPTGGCLWPIGSRPNTSCQNIH
jgi:hypothetical protein